MSFMETGFVGNVWIAQNVLPKAGMKVKQHSHVHDHASLLVSGSARVSISGSEPKEFKAPTFIVIKADFDHQFEALEDNTIWYCVFALRDLNGKVITEAELDNIPPLDLVMATTKSDAHYRHMYNDLKMEYDQAQETIAKLRDRVRLLRSGLLLGEEWDQRAEAFKKIQDTQSPE